MKCLLSVLDSRSFWSSRNFFVLRHRAESFPVVVQLAPQLRNARRSHTKLPADIERALAHHQSVDDPAIALGLSLDPRRPVDAKSGLIGHGRLGVVGQT